MSMPSSEARTSLPAMTIQDGCTVRPEASTVNLEVESEPYSSTFVTGILRLLLARHPINFVISRLVKKYVFERNLNQKLSITSNTKSLYLKKKKKNISGYTYLVSYSSSQASYSFDHQSYFKQHTYSISVQCTDFSLA